jgi:hypothetical protein
MMTEVMFSKERNSTSMRAIFYFAAFVETESYPAAYDLLAAENQPVEGKLRDLKRIPKTGRATTYDLFILRTDGERA